MKPSIRKQNDRWVVKRPGYGFSAPTVADFDSWKAAVGSLRSAPASTGSLTERGHHSLSLSQSLWGPRRGTIRLEDT